MVYLDRAVATLGEHGFAQEKLYRKPDALAIYHRSKETFCDE
jgi:hypothetical protein